MMSVALKLHRWHYKFSCSFDSQGYSRTLGLIHNLQHPGRSIWLSQHTRRCASTSSEIDQEHLFRTTGVRWLWDEERRMSLTYKKFNVAELQKVAADAVGAQKCISITKTNEYVSSREFRMTMDNGTAVIARVLHSRDEVIPKVMSSEAAVLTFARNILDLPAPRVLAYNDDETSSIGCKYLIHTNMTGPPLEETYNTMGISDRLKVIEQLVKIQKKLSSVTFSQYGSLYLSDDAPPSSIPVQIQGDLTEAQKEEAAQHYRIGPVTTVSSWKGDRALMDVSRGPWQTVSQYFDAICDREIEYLQKHAQVPTYQRDGFTMEISWNQDDQEHHVSLYKQLKNISQHIFPQNSDLLRATLSHPALSGHNIHADGNKITGIKGWSNAWIGCLLLETGRLELLDSIDIGFQETKPKDRLLFRINTIMAEWKMISLLKNFEHLMQELLEAVYLDKTEAVNPALYELYTNPNGGLISNLVSFSKDSWGGDVTSLRSIMLRIILEWQNINPAIPCPISFTDEEIENHEEGMVSYPHPVGAHLVQHVPEDGRVRSEDYEELKSHCIDAREMILAELDEEDWDDFEQATRWIVGLDGGSASEKSGLEGE